MTEEDPNPQEQRSPTGKPMTPGTPKDVTHVLLGGTFLVIAIGVGVVAAVAGIWWLLVVAAIAAVAIVVDIVLALRRQKSLGSGPRSRD